MTRNRSLLPRAWTVLGIVLLVFASCGGGSDSSKDNEEDTTTTTSSTTTSTTEATSSTTTTTRSTFGNEPTSTTLAAADVAVEASDVPETTNLSVQSGPSTVNGTSYANALLIEPGGYSGPTSKLEIDAGRDYKRFRADLGIPDDQTSGTAYKAEISIDNAAPILSTEVRFGETKKIDVDITNGLRIRIVFTSLSECCESVALGNPRFTR